MATGILGILGFCLLDSFPAESNESLAFLISSRVLFLLLALIESYFPSFPLPILFLIVVARLMLFVKIVSEHASSEYDFPYRDDDMMGSMDRSKNRDTNQKQYHPHPHSPEPLSSMLRRSTRDLLHVTSMRVYNISTLKSGARGEMGMRMILPLGGVPIFTPAHGLDLVHFIGTGLCESRRMLSCVSRAHLQEFHASRAGRVRYSKPCFFSSC